MLDLGWSELLVIGVVALIVVGPKDLPGMFKQLGRFTAKMRSMARDFSRAMEDAAKESGVGDVAGDLKKVANAKSLGLDKLKEAADNFENWDPGKAGEGKAVGPETAKMTQERAEQARLIREASDAKARARIEAGETAGDGEAPRDDSPAPAAEPSAPPEPGDASAPSAGADSSVSAPEADKK